MKFFIPSYNRLDRCRTVKYLNSIGIEKERIIVSTQNKKDFDAYTAKYGKIATILYREAHNCAGNRNTLVDYMDDGEVGLFFDDDLYSVQEYRFIEGSKYGKLFDLDRDGFDRFCNEGAKLIEDGASLVGLAWNSNVTNIYRALSAGKYIDQTKTISGAAMFVVNDDELRFDETLDCLDDTEICLRRMVNGDKVLRMNNYIMNKPQDTKEKGGCFDVYQSGKKIEVLKEMDKRFYPFAKHKKDWTGMQVKAGMR